MAVENWIDAIVKVWGGIQSGDGTTVRSFRVFEKAEWPEAMDVFPCALTYTQDVRPQYSAGGPNITLWTGVTEFHIVPNVQKQAFPKVMQFFSKILVAAAGNLTLSAKVSYFLLDHENRPGIQGPVTLKYGEASEHLGLLVNWNVKELVSGLTVGG